MLIVRTGAMGDVLHGLPAAAALRHALPGCTLGWAVDPRWAPLLGASPDAAGPVIDRLHLVPTRDWNAHPCSGRTLRSIVRLRRELQGERYDVCVDLQGTIRSAIIGRMAGAARFTGLKRTRESQAKHLYRERVAVRSASVIGQACELVAAALGIALPAPVQPAFPVDAAAERWCKAALEPLAGRPFALLATGGGWGAKRWSAACFAEVAEGLRERGLSVLEAVAPDSRLDPALVEAGVLPIPSDVAQLLALTRRAALVVGGDTGPMHLAAALGRPVVALFGPTDPARNGPQFPGARAIVLRESASVTTYRRHPDTEAGLARLPPAAVLAAADRLLQTGQRTEEASHG